MFKAFNSIFGVLTLVFTLISLPGSHMAEAKTTVVTTTTKTNPKLLTRNRGGGRIKVVYGESDDPFSNQLMQGDREVGLFQGIADLITSEIQLPRDVTLSLQDCGQANAFYSKDDRQIVLCNELMKTNYERFKKANYGDEESLQLALYVNIFFLYHEAGHLLISELDLPIVGREEDVADQFSAFFILSNFDTSQDKSTSGKILLSAAELFKINSKNPTKGDYIDEHGLNPQRFYNLVCMLYGKHPEAYQDLISSLNYPEERAARCQQESELMFNSWQRLLEPYLVKN
jgi:hypothetical protein